MAAAGFHHRLDKVPWSELSPAAGASQEPFLRRRDVLRPLMCCEMQLARSLGPTL
eukprot:CAMPEP_0197637780 /NCGR_PEP_ID=MMETSP1338-20131121/12903_1 /TAXON_ID=43686 ORGANISM="Pelagodinium beii, Strain RCC1491" /NCGR_SAMPLE_ID=MMETSP1338 /ASSEMBLY_ACC=CAM_ASM_000754 /LENGTH=54 /DNA_ID=CAMNT_0043210251 /DNA_START=386 /DNA_END=547 /DNA_ORIENTATION=+